MSPRDIKYVVQLTRLVSTADKYDWQHCSEWDQDSKQVNGEENPVKY